MKNKSLDFKDLDNYLTNKVNKNGSISSKNVFSKITEFIHTGNYILNAQISGSLFGGIPNSRTVTFAGREGSGKTYLALNCCLQAQKKGYNIIYCDTEAAVDYDQFVKFGFDTDRVRYQPINTVSELKYFISNLLNFLKENESKGIEVPKIMIVLDSLGNLATDKEVADAMTLSTKKDMTKQQEVKSLFRIITVELAKFKIPFIVCNHVYAAINSYVPQDIISGGSGILFNSSIILQLIKSQMKGKNDSDLKYTGIIVRSKPLKNRLAKPIEVKFHISFFTGMNPYVGLENYISWKNCGIERGYILTEKEFLKRTKNEQDHIMQNNYDFVFEDKKLYFQPKGSAKSFAVKHLGTTIKPNELFSPTVFTDDVLKELDDNVIKPTFLFPNVINIYDIPEYILHDDSDDTNIDILDY